MLTRLQNLLYDAYLAMDMDEEEAYASARSNGKGQVVDVVLGSSWVEVTTSIEDGLTQQAFIHGACGWLAGAVFEKTGFPLVRLTSPRATPTHWRGHWALRVDEGSYLDARGLIGEAELLEPFTGDASTWTREEGAHLYQQILAEVAGGHATANLDELEQLLIAGYAEQLAALVPAPTA